MLSKRLHAVASEITCKLLAQQRFMLVNKNLSFIRYELAASSNPGNMR
jgi:hypothetical protein